MSKKGKKNTVVENKSPEKEVVIDDGVFQKRLKQHHDELRWLYMELYENDSMFAELCDELRRFYLERKEELKAADCKREEERDWY